MTEQQPTTDTHDMSWFLKRLADEKGVLHALLVTGDGLVRARSKDLGRDVADPTAASTAGLLSLATTFAEFAQAPAGTTVGKIIIDMPEQCVLVFRAGDNTVLAVAVGAPMTSPEVGVASSAAIKAIKGMAPALAAAERTRTP
ncbi:roadblock/LC7 domain-containing protein [Streptomyces californicus]|uniref:roadblock/LC7 domain-containing protein n=1 Tax=Streptomyces californicus TaxID=67351 RepID=UPI00371584CC